MKFNDTPPPKPTPAPNSSIFLPLVLVLGTMGFAIYKIIQSLPELPAEPMDPLMARYGSNRMPNWHPTPYKHTENPSRSPCPLLNTLANHGYLPRDGRNIDRKTLGTALEHLNLSPGYVDAKLSDDELVFDLSDLQQHNIIEHDVSLTRQDYRPFLGADRHWRADKTLVEQLKAFADKDGFLSYDAVAQARNLRQKQSNAEAATIEKEQGSSLTDEDTPHSECSALLNVLGRNGKIHKSSIDSFVLNERFPEDWAPPREQVGLAEFLAGAIKCGLYRYSPGNLWPAEPELASTSTTYEDAMKTQSASEHAEL
ncbi:Chloroperoxidase [Syncephalis plumigaleata]|nr:Chloroperoxidase [Syncephalis plumigaleata]